MRTGFWRPVAAARAEGTIASSHGSPKVTPAPRNKVLREIGVLTV